uniref:Prolactin n=1 Tax=Athene cunicularia TaxID=194338 RepID=A0A663MS18_ATHCN
MRNEALPALQSFNQSTLFLNLHCKRGLTATELLSEKQREELTHLILKLLQAWKEPLSHFNQHIEHHQELPDDSLSKAKQISNMIHELKTGVEKVTEKSELYPSILSSGSNMMSDSDFIHCFRRDSNKVQSYLKILKCRIMPENSC